MLKARRLQLEVVGSGMGSINMGAGHFCPPGRWEEKVLNFVLSISPHIGKWTKMSTPPILPTTFSHLP
jgi:hypothetical protein